KVEIKDAINVSGLTMLLDRPAEWQQIFTEAWRQMRDFFYAPNMHGLDWKAVHDKYQPLVQYVNHRNDLTYIMGEMVGELNVGHAYVGGGDRPHPKRIKTGLLGADVKRDQSGYYQITRILDGENWDKTRRSPLTEIGVNVNEGDYILAVNGVSTRGMKNIFSAFINTADHQVILTVNERPETDGSHEEIIIPVDNEQGLYYHNWVQTNINKVTDATDGKVGYIHIPDMLSSGLNEFAKQYYPQLKKKALIIDVRGNGGGNVSPMIIERLRREIVMIDVARNTAPTTDPNEILWGPTVCLINEYSASDGDLFPYRYKTLKMGELIGKRTWGGVVGIRGSLPFLDGGTLHKPEYSRYDLAGKTWAIEGHGVDPTIEVENDPHDVFNGKDAQLERAITEILDDLKTDENTIPAMPPYPVK
ncbi:PDZ domain-containing protein, partial [bacterium]|nr:PDZ domain-containing protein [bacterium]